jgi:hypothetical protein
VHVCTYTLCMCAYAYVGWGAEPFVVPSCQLNVMHYITCVLLLI